ncbi:major facilitator superfamily domain-containing protein [Apiospora saccharicola]|uniref:Major facilitator superfamily domain-containing protein n=1 Tax=Apiospora saccharicola TaxID=335842 RepID=A0ABR1UQ19_9PEZI
MAVLGSSTAHARMEKAAERRLLRRLDFRVLPILWLLYLVSFVDRSNIGNAKIQGMDQELQLTGQRYNIALFVFNIGYLVAGVPLSVAFKKTGPKSLAVMMFCWGLTVIGCGLTRSWAGLVVCRLLEGMAESAFVPGAAYLIGSYYRRDEFLRRYVVFFSGGICAGAFNGFLSALIAKMDGVSGYRAWRWIFIIEGVLTILVSFASYFFIVPFPEGSTFLMPEDKDLLLARLRDDRDDVAHEDRLPARRLLDFLRDWKIWAAVVIYLGAAENANSITSFQPTILRGLGYDAAAAQVRTIPVYLAAAVYSIAMAYAAERLGQRYLFCMVGFGTIAAGLAVQIAQPRTSPGVRYMGLFFMTAGAYLVMPLAVVLIAVNVGKGYKRTVALGAIVCFGNAGSFIGTNVYLRREEPTFRTGFSTGLGLCAVGMLAATGLFVGVLGANRRRDEKRDALAGVLQERSIEHLGERYPDFRYCT